MKDKNIYILCLEKGYNNGEQGTSYIEMIKYLESNGFTIDESFHNYFYVWFFDNFYQNNITNERAAKRQNMNLIPWQFHKPQYEESLKEPKTTTYYNLKAVMTFEARQNYLNYLRFKASDRKSNRALIIAIVTSIISVALGAWQMAYIFRQDDFNTYTIKKQVEEQHESAKEDKEVQKQLQEIQRSLPKDK